jgi:Tfp pilus assembly protein PilV
VTLAEVAIAIVLLAVVLLPLLGVFLKGVRSVEVSWREARAMVYASELLEIIKSLPWADAAVLPLTGTPPVVDINLLAAVIQTEGGGLNDVDDYNGFTSTDPGIRLTRTAVVDFVTVTPPPYGFQQSVASTNLKRVTVTVRDEIGTQLAQVTTVMANTP